MGVEVVGLLKVQESHLCQSWPETIVVGRQTTPMFGEAEQAIFILARTLFKDTQYRQTPQSTNGLKEAAESREPRTLGIRRWRRVN